MNNTTIKSKSGYRNPDSSYQLRADFTKNRSKSMGDKLEMGIHNLLNRQDKAKKRKEKTVECGYVYGNELGHFFLQIPLENPTLESTSN